MKSPTLATLLSFLSWAAASVPSQALAIPMASQTWVSNRITEATAASTNYTDQAMVGVTNRSPHWTCALGTLAKTMGGYWIGRLTNQASGESYKCIMEHNQSFWSIEDDGAGLGLDGSTIGSSESTRVEFDISEFSVAVEAFGTNRLVFVREGMLSEYVTHADLPTNHVTQAELEAAIESIPEVDTSDLASKEDVTAVSNQIPPIVNSVNTMWATMYGENVWLAVTNYMRQVAGTVPSLRLWEVRDNNTNLVYSSQEEIEHVVTQRVHTVETNLTAKMTRKAWGSYQSSGEDNPSSNTVTVINSEKIMLTGGGKWYKTIETGSASVWVLETQGVTTLGGDTNGFFRITDLEGNAQLEVVKTADQEVDAVASDTDFDASNNFTVTYNASGSNHPLVSCALDLNDDFDEENGNGEINSLGITVTWAKNGDNLWVATIHQDTRAERLFVHAKMTVQGVNLIRNTAPATFDGGIYINNVRYRLVPYSSGGKTYLTLEAW